MDVLQELAGKARGGGAEFVAAADMAFAAVETAGRGEGLLRENDAWVATFSLPAAQRLISGGLRDGAQTPAGERDLEGLMRGVAH